MPSIILTSTPNTTKDDVIGWGTRLIFSQNIPQGMDLNYTDYFDSIDPTLTRGTLGLFPKNYFSQGRILRLRASMFYSGSDSKLDIGARVVDGFYSISCTQNNGNTHSFAVGANVSNVPVELEINYVRTGDDNGFAISGFYRYEWGSYDGGGANTKVVYVPMNYVYTNTLDFSQNIQFLLQISDNPVTINWMTIEELG